MSVLFRRVGRCGLLLLLLSLVLTPSRGLPQPYTPSSSTTHKMENYTTIHTGNYQLENTIDNINLGNPHHAGRSLRDVNGSAKPQPIRGTLTSTGHQEDNKRGDNNLGNRIKRTSSDHTRIDDLLHKGILVQPAEAFGGGGGMAEFIRRTAALLPMVASQVISDTALGGRRHRTQSFDSDNNSTLPPLNETSGEASAVIRPNSTHQQHKNGTFTPLHLEKDDTSPVHLEKVGMSGSFHQHQQKEGSSSLVLQEHLKDESFAPVQQQQQQQQVKDETLLSVHQQQQQDDRTSLHIQQHQQDDGPSFHGQQQQQDDGPSLLIQQQQQDDGPPLPVPQQQQDDGPSLPVQQQQQDEPSLSVHQQQQQMDGPSSPTHQQEETDTPLIFLLQEQQNLATHHSMQEQDLPASPALVLQQQEDVSASFFLMQQQQQNAPHLLRQQNDTPSLLQQLKESTTLLHQQNATHSLLQPQNSPPFLINKQNALPSLLQQQSAPTSFLQQQNDFSSLLHQQEDPSSFLNKEYVAPSLRQKQNDSSSLHKQNAPPSLLQQKNDSSSFHKQNAPPSFHQRNNSSLLHQQNDHFFILHQENVHPSFMQQHNNHSFPLYQQSKTPSFLHQQDDHPSLLKQQNPPPSLLHQNSFHSFLPKQQQRDPPYLQHQQHQYDSPSRLPLDMDTLRNMTHYYASLSRNKNHDSSLVKAPSQQEVKQHRTYLLMLLQKLRNIDEGTKASMSTPAGSASITQPQQDRMSYVSLQNIYSGVPKRRVGTSEVGFQNSSSGTSAPKDQFSGGPTRMKASLNGLRQALVGVPANTQSHNVSVPALINRLQTQGITSLLPVSFLGEEPLLASSTSPPPTFHLLYDSHAVPDGVEGSSDGDICSIPKPGPQDPDELPHYNTNSSGRPTFLSPIHKQFPAVFTLLRDFPNSSSQQPPSSQNGMSGIQLTSSGATHNTSKMLLEHAHKNVSYAKWKPQNEEPIYLTLQDDINDQNKQIASVSSGGSFNVQKRYPPPSTFRLPFDKVSEISSLKQQMTKAHIVANKQSPSFIPPVSANKQGPSLIPPAAANKQGPSFIPPAAANKQGPSFITLAATNKQDPSFIPPAAANKQDPSFIPPAATNKQDPSFIPPAATNKQDPSFIPPAATNKQDPSIIPLAAAATGPKEPILTVVHDANLFANYNALLKAVQMVKQINRLQQTSPLDKLGPSTTAVQTQNTNSHPPYTFNPTPSLYFLNDAAGGASELAPKVTTAVTTLITSVGEAISTFFQDLAKAISIFFDNLATTINETPAILLLCLVPLFFLVLSYFIVSGTSQGSYHHASHGGGYNGRKSSVLLLDSKAVDALARFILTQIESFEEGVTS